MTVRAVLYDAKGEDRELDLSDATIKIDDDRLLWIDLDSREPADLARAGAVIGLDERGLRRLGRVDRRSRLLRLPDRIVITLGVVEPDDPDVVRHELDIVVGPNHIVTVHDGPLVPVDDFRREIASEELVGRLDSASFIAGLIDSVFTAYFRQIEGIERDIDALDELAIRTRADASFLSDVVVLRRRIGRLRRALTPNREALLPLERPDVTRTSDLGATWPGIGHRLERAIDGVENARELLVGSFDLYLGRSAQRTNDVMKILTLVSAIALPGIVLAGVMGMNFQMSFFDEPNNFFVVAGVMIGVAAVILAAARWRKWV